MTGHIRWHDGGDDSIVTIRGYVGTLAPAVFGIYAPHLPGDEWILTSSLPHWKLRTTADDPDDLKAEAERWLAEFVSSLGAAFPDEPADDPDCEECGFGLPRHDKNCSHFPATPAPIAGEKE